MLSNGSDTCENDTLIFVCSCMCATVRARVNLRPYAERVQVYTKGKIEVKAMTFDLDDTLYDNLPVIKNAVAAMFEELVSKYPEIKVSKSTQTHTHTQGTDQCPNLHDCPSL